MDAIRREISHAARRLVRSPAFALATVLTLALAMGANAAIFAVVERVVLNPLPYPDSDRVIDLDHGGAGVNVTTGIAMTLGLYYQYTERARTLESIALYRTTETTVTGSGEPERIRITYATPSLAAVLRVPPRLGRWFTIAEGTPGAAPAALLSYRLWMRRYGGDPAIVGRPVLLNGVPTEVAGVMPPSFAFPTADIDVWSAEPLTRRMEWDTFGHSGVARIREDATVAAARAELSGVIADLPRAYPNDPGITGFMKNVKMFSAARTLKDATVGRVARTLWILLASVGLVLLVACANIANLFLVRSDARQRELAVRRALGAGTLGIARYFLAESALLSAAGGVLGLMLAWMAVRLLIASAPANLPRVGEIRLDAIAVAFTVGLTMLTALVFGALPLWRGGSLASSLHEGGRSSTAGPGRQRVRHLLMGGQVALALVLLVSSGLMIRSFQKLRAIDPGFDATSALTFRVGLPASEYPTQAAAVATQQAILDRLSALPGIVRVSAATRLPLVEDGSYFGTVLRIEGQPRPERSIPPIVSFRAVAGDYLETIGTRIVRGHAISRADVERKEPIAVVNQALVTAYFPGEDPIGRRITLGPVRNRGWLTVVGIAVNTPLTALAEPTARAQAYFPMSLARGTDLPVAPDPAVMSVVVRTTTAPLGLLPPVRNALKAIDANIALAQVRTLDDVVDRASAQMAFTMILLAIAASVALLLGVIGIYGVMSYIVSQRTGEIGVRLALGAEPRSVARMIVRQGGLVALAGIAVGLASAFAASRVVASLLYGVSPRDPGVFAATTIALLTVALVACWLPARRAARLSPVEALRTD